MLALRRSRPRFVFALTVVAAILIVISESSSAAPDSPSPANYELRASRSINYVPTGFFQENKATSTRQISAFEEIEKEVKAGRVTTLIFYRTELDDKARAIAQVLIKGQKLTVRVMARDIPDPSQFGAARYALWVYIENYQVRHYLGDLPISITSPSHESSSTRKAAKNSIARGESDCSYRLDLMPADAKFGGLILSAEPASFTPVINEAFRPVLTTLIVDTRMLPK